MLLSKDWLGRSQAKFFRSKIWLKKRKKVFYLNQDKGSEMSFQVKEPDLIIGLGGVGSKLASEAKKSRNSDWIVICNDEKDCTSDESIRISTDSVVSPSVQLIRGSAYKVSDEIKSKISEYSTIVVKGCIYKYLLVFIYMRQYLMFFIFCIYCYCISYFTISGCGGRDALSFFFHAIAPWILSQRPHRLTR